jgi:Mor family transcriptional regulator
MSAQGEMFDPMSADPIDLIEHMGDRVPPTHQWPPLLADLFAVQEAYNRRKGMNETDAAVDARDRCVLLADYFGGRMVYIPTGERLHQALRDALIWAEFKGHNQLALCQKYELTQVRVYQILAEQRALMVKERQGKLFNEEGEKR